MAVFDPKSFGIDSRTDVGLFLLVGGLAGIVDAVFNIAQSDPLTVGAMFGVTAVGAKKLLLDSDKTREFDDSRKDPPQAPD